MFFSTTDEGHPSGGQRPWQTVPQDPENQDLSDQGEGATILS